MAAPVEPVGAAVLVVPVVPDCWQAPRNATVITRAIRDSRCLFMICFSSHRAESLVVLNHVTCWECLPLLLRFQIDPGSVSLVQMHYNCAIVNHVFPDDQPQNWLQPRQRRWQPRQRHLLQCQLRVRNRLQGATSRAHLTRTEQFLEKQQNNSTRAADLDLALASIVHIHTATPTATNRGGRAGRVGSGKKDKVFVLGT